MEQEPHPPAGPSLDCELCIVGAGYAALNALNAAAKYLKKGDRVVVIDKNETWGGQWIHQYDFVRLHQPYRMFTAGDQPWTLKRERSHLATRREVLDQNDCDPSVSGTLPGTKAAKARSVNCLPSGWLWIAYPLADISDEPHARLAGVRASLVDGCACLPEGRVLLAHRRGLSAGRPWSCRT